jgi:excisionase family DNA binding protein
MVTVTTPEEALGLDRLPPTLTVEQAATLLGVSKQTIYRAVESGEMRGLKVRGRLVVSTRPLAEALGWL